MIKKLYLPFILLLFLGCGEENPSSSHQTIVLSASHTEIVMEEQKNYVLTKGMEILPITKEPQLLLETNSSTTTITLLEGEAKIILDSKNRG